MSVTTRSLVRITTEAKTTTQQTPPKSGAPLGSGQRGGGHNNTTTRDVEPTRHRGFELFCHFIIILFFDPLESEAPNHSLNKISGEFSVSSGKYSSMSYASNSFASLSSISGSGTINCSVAGSLWIFIEIPWPARSKYCDRTVGSVASSRLDRLYQ